MAVSVLFVASYSCLLAIAPQRARVFLLILASYVFMEFGTSDFLTLLLTSTIVAFLGAGAIEGKRQSSWQVALLSTIPLVWLIVCAWTGRTQIPSTAFMATLGFIILLNLAHSLFWLFQEEARRKAFVAFSIITNLTILGFFKYFNFFADSTRNLLENAGIQVGWVLPHIILPIGISFYTFQTLAYVIDVYRKQQKPAKIFQLMRYIFLFFLNFSQDPLDVHHN
ncbi:MAG: hypothetical protein MZW92_32765 [Comamonadaceae bacterium]|nr:hypothetical protein [Comamonadaceae bacterium]